MNTAININAASNYTDWFFIAITAITVFMTFLFFKRTKTKIGCFSAVYVWLIIFTVISLTPIAWLFMYQGTKDVYFAMSHSSTYTAKIIDRKFDYQTDDGDDMYQPIVRFVTEDGQVVEKTLSFSTTGVEIGEVYRVKYDKNKDELVTLGFPLVLGVIAPLIFVVVLTFLSIGIIIFVLNGDMAFWVSAAKTFGFYVFVPFLMICFDAGLIYGLFNDSGTTVTTTSAIFGESKTTTETYGAGERPLDIDAVLVFMIFMLTLGIIGYIKMIFAKGTPELKYKGGGRWVGDWKEKQEEKQKQKEKKRNKPSVIKRNE